VCTLNTTATTKIHTPVKALRAEFTTLKEAELDRRLTSVYLSVTGTYTDKVDRLIDYVVTKEME
jgi:hypothetical protein